MPTTTSTNFKFTSAYRIQDRRDFLKLKDRGRKFYSKNFIFLYSRNKLDNSRIGITITTKIDKSSVVRNKLKRRIREIFRLYLRELKGNLDIVVIAKNEATKEKFVNIHKEILQSLHREGLIAKIASRQ